MNKYVALAKVGTSYSRKMNHLSNRIFGEVTRPSSMKQIKICNKLKELPKSKDPDVVDYYHRLPEAYYFFRHLRDYGLFQDEHADFKDEMDRRRRLRGKEKERPEHKLKNTPEYNPYIELTLK